MFSLRAQPFPHSPGIFPFLPSCIRPQLGTAEPGAAFAVKGEGSRAGTSASEMPVLTMFTPRAAAPSSRARGCAGIQLLPGTSSQPCSCRQRLCQKPGRNCPDIIIYLSRYYPDIICLSERQLHFQSICIYIEKNLLFSPVLPWIPGINCCHS